MTWFEGLGPRVALVGRIQEAYELCEAANHVAGSVPMTSMKLVYQFGMVEGAFSKRCSTEPTVLIGFLIVLCSGSVPPRLLHCAIR